MTDSRSGTDDTSIDDTTSSEQYGAFTTDDGDTIVYDRTNSAAWIQSDYAIEVGGDRSSA